MNNTEVDDAWLVLIKAQAQEYGATELTVYWNNNAMCFCAEWEGNSLKDQFIEYGDYDEEEDGDAELYLADNFNEADYIKEFSISL